MKEYEFFIAGATRNKDQILAICNLFDELKISYYCFLKNEESNTKAGLNMEDDPEAIMRKFEKMALDSNAVKEIFKADMEAEKKCKHFLLVLPAGKSGHIEAGIAYGLKKRCYAIGEYEATDSLYLIFEQIFASEQELLVFLKKMKEK